MALTLPMETLSSIKVSFKVGLPDGTFTFDMVPVNAPDTGFQPEPGMRLHLDAIRDSTGITLTLFTSRRSDDDTVFDSLQKTFESSLATSPASSHWSSQSHSALPEPPLDYCKSRSVQECPPSEPERPMDLEFVSYSQPIPACEPIDMSLHNIPMGRFDSPEYQFELDDVQRNFDEFLLDSLNLEYHHNDDPNATQFNHGAELDESPKASSVSDCTFAEDTPDLTSVSSEPSASGSPAMRPRGARSRNLRCPEISCARHFTSKYTLSKHITTHEPKSQKFFPCTMGCTMRFSRKHDRLRHEVTQHGRVCEWGCNACLGFFSSESTLKKHKCRNPGGTRWVSDQG
ncbi:hypothetical protein FB451DRAFT_1272684 [Mycena latifolia]|nr:hypothetical protein FB451DRAFT_1272684 [Mycena latifolia]